MATSSASVAARPQVNNRLHIFRVSPLTTSISHCTHLEFCWSKATAQVNEALCKVLCHNICVIIQSM